MDDVDTAPPIAAVARDPEPQEVAPAVAAWDVVHHAVADVPTVRGVRALLRSTDGDFRITADRVNGRLALTIEARRDPPSVVVGAGSEKPPDHT